MEKEVIYTPDAPEPGPYSQAVKYGNLVFVAGQTPEDPNTNQPVKGTVAEQTRLVLSNIETILKSAGSSLAQALRVNVYLSSMDYKNEMNEVYRSFFQKDPPVRCTVAVAGIDDNLDVEIEVIAGVD